MRIPLFGRLKKRATAENGTSGDAPSRTGGKVVKAGQITQPSTLLLGRYNFVGAKNIVPRQTNVLFDIDVDRLRSYTATTLLRNLNVLSPDASMALWTYLRLCGTEFECSVTDPSGADSVKGLMYMDQILENVARETGGIRNLLTQAFKTVYVQGACAAEVVLEPNLRDLHNLVIVDPATITFFAEERGEAEMKETVFVPYQQQGGQYVSLEKEGFYYVPLDPDIGDPYGSSPILSVIQTIFFYMRVISDLNQVVHNQAWERLHVKVMEEILRKNVSDQLKRNDQKMANYIDQQLAKISTLYNSMEPDDTFITTDSTEISEVGGKHNAGLMSVKVLMDVIERLLANSLKTMSTFLNQHKGKTETYSSVEWMIQVSGVEAIRDIVASMFNNAFTFILQMAGIQAKVEMMFPEIPLNSEEQVERMAWYKTRRVLTERDAGIIGHDTAAHILYDIPKAEGEEKTASFSKAQSARGTLRSGERQLVDRHKGGWTGLKFSRLRDLESALRQDLESEYRLMEDKIVKELVEKAKFKKAP